MKKLIYIFTALALLCSCRTKFQEDWPTLKMDKDKFTYGATATKALLYIYYNGDWTAEVTKGAGWAALDKTSGTGVYGNHLRFTVNPGVSRLCEVTVRGGEDVWIMTVVQSGVVSEPKIIFASDKRIFMRDKTEGLLTVDSNIPMAVFKTIVPTVVYPDTVAAWLDSVTILEKEDSVEIPDMPDGTRRYVRLKFSENTLGKDRQAAIELAVVDAESIRYSGVTEVVQSCRSASISLPSEDRVSKAGGLRTIPVTTNLGEDIASAQVSVNYTSGSDFITDAHVTADANLVYTVAQNTTDNVRKATLTVTCQGVGASMEVHQKSGSTSYTDYKVESLYDFLEWANDSGAWKPTDKITLAVDIDLTGQTYEPHAFSGTFDGQGHTVSGLNIVSSSADAGFFTVLSGTLKDVTFGSSSMHGSITASADTVNVGIVGRMSGSADISGVTSYVDITATGSKEACVGGIAGLCESTGSIVGCTNCGKIQDIDCNTLTKSTNNPSVGGVAGKMAAACAIKDCTNYGEIYGSVYTSSTFVSSSLSLGGILGWSTAGGSLERCHNYGNISYGNDCTDIKSRIVLRAGGVLGAGTITAMDKFEDCHSGTDQQKIMISNTGKSVKSFYIGGIVGSLSVQTPVTNCTAYTDINIGGIVTYPYAGGLAGSVSGGVFSNNTVGASLTYTGEFNTNSGSSNTGLVRAGLCVGSISGSATFEDCIVSGKIANQAVVAYSPRIGGFFGSVTTSGTDVILGNCSVDCVIENSRADDGIVIMGGFCGYQESSSSLTFTSCSVRGSIASLVKPTKEYVGGFYGYGYSSSSAGSFTGCTARCDITLLSDSPYKYAGAFLGFGKFSPTVSGCFAGASNFNGTALNSANYGTYLQGTSSAATVNVNTTNISFTE